MKIGDTVKVYQKPLTYEDYEGEAVVRRILFQRKEGNGVIFRAVVNFPEDGPHTVVERTIAEGKVV